MLVVSRRRILLESILYSSPALFTSPIFCPTKKTFLPLNRADFGYFWLNLGLILVNFDSFWLILAYFWGIVANFGQNHLNSHAKSNLPWYLDIINSNFVNTEPIFKIRNSAESYWKMRKFAFTHRTENNQTDGSKTETTLSSVDTRGSWPIDHSLWSKDGMRSSFVTILFANINFEPIW